MLASEILRRMILTATTTKIRAVSGGADVGVFNAGGLAVGGDIDAAAVAASGALTNFGAATAGTLITPELDFLLLNDTVTVHLASDVPAGYTFVVVGARTSTTAITGAPGSGFTVSLGNDVGISNLLSLNNGTAGTVDTNRTITLVAPTAQPDLSLADLQAKVTLASTVATVWKGKIILQGVWWAL